MKKIKIILGTFLLIVLLTSTAWCGEEFLSDPAAMPEDFRGIRWGQDIGTLQGMTLVYFDEGEGGTTIYTRESDVMAYGDAKLSSIEYIFNEGKLYEVAVVAKGAADEAALLEAAIADYGKETVQSGGDYMWRFPSLSVMYSPEPEEGQAVLFFKHIR